MNPLPIHQADPAFASRLDAAFDVIRAAIRDRAFPGAAIAATRKGELVVLEAFGRFTYDLDAPAVDRETVFDIASVSKVVATTAMAMLLNQRGKLDLESPVAKVVPEFVDIVPKDLRRDGVTIRMLLAHSSGLPAYVRLFESSATREALLAAAFRVPLESTPLSCSVYSDIGFIILGIALERIAGETLSAFCSREIFRPLEMAHTCFQPPAAWKPLIPPTDNDLHFRRRVIQGEVNDENASLLGGVAGHAGVFAPAADLARFALCMLRGGSPIFLPATVAHFTKRENLPTGTSRALGWDTPSAPSQSGKRFSPRAYGHLGFTGPSLWIDPEHDVSIVFLTNRTWPDRASQSIKEVRPALHDVMMDVLLSI